MELRKGIVRLATEAILHCTLFTFLLSSCIYDWNSEVIVVVVVVKVNSNIRLRFRCGVAGMLYGVVFAHCLPLIVGLSVIIGRLKID